MPHAKHYCTEGVDGRTGAVAYLGFGKGGHGERAEREPITGVWGRSPPEAETLFAFECLMEAANSPIFF